MKSKKFIFTKLVIVLTLYSTFIFCSTVDFKELRKTKVFVDKTLFIEEIQDGPTVLVYCYPNGFGKSLNLSMVKYFYEESEETNDYLFYDTKIWLKSRFRDLQGKFPVIYLDFNDIQEVEFPYAVDKISNLIIKEYIRFKPKIFSFLNEYEQKFYSEDFNEYSLADKLERLICYLYKYTGIRPFVLIDGFDKPLFSAYCNDYYMEMKQFLLNLFIAFKDNAALGKAVLMGSLPMPRPHEFGGFNNFVEKKLLNNFSSNLGFIESEIMTLGKQDQEKAKMLEQYYGGHISQITKLYNVFSVISYLQNEELINFYWIKQSGNDFIKNSIIKVVDTIREDLSKLLSNGYITKEIKCTFELIDLKIDPNAIWNLLYYQGYLTYDDSTKRIFIPNEELKVFFRSVLSIN